MDSHIILGDLKKEFMAVCALRFADALVNIV